LGFILLQVQILQQQITALADTQFSSDDRYSRSKQENAALTARYVHVVDIFFVVSFPNYPLGNQPQLENRQFPVYLIFLNTVCTRDIRVLS
jgi:hypothetical protein